MLLIHALQTRLFRGAGGAPTPPPATSDPIGRRRRTRTYRAPTVKGLEEDFEQIREAVPEEVLLPLIGPYLLRGDMPRVNPPASMVDWSALAQDAKTVIRLVDAYLEYIEEEDIAVILLGA